MAIIYINKKKYNFSHANNLLQTCLSLNIDIPYFCWHPELGSVGFCRLCAVKQYNNLNDSSGRIIMSCITPIVNNMIITTHDTEVNKFRKGIIELLMTNHPHDCPICEEGGNCHLQDMTVLTGHHNRRYTFDKRIHKNQYLGHFISHQMNRCIGCYRCVRYYKDYAGGTDFGVYGASNNIYFGRFEDGCLDSEHSGNLIEVCPTGVFTDKLSSKNYNRKWDLQHAPSICQHCSIGCNIIVGEKYGIVSKIENRYHSHINRYFLCDLGRFGYNYVNTKYRLKYPIQVFQNKCIILNQNDSIDIVSNILKNTNRIMGIGSIRSSLENNFALRKLVGKENFSSGMLDNEHKCVKLIIDILENSGLYIPTLYEVESYDLVLIIGEDITHTSPRLDLAIRQLNKIQQSKNYQQYNVPKWHNVAMLNISNKKTCIYIVHTHEIKLDNISAMSHYASIRDQEIFTTVLAHKIYGVSHSFKNLTADVMNDTEIIYKALLSCKKPLIISGTHSGSINLIHSSTNIAQGLQALKKDVGLILLTASSNSIGVGLISDFSMTDVMNKISSDQIDTLVILENDLYRYVLKKDMDCILKKIKNIIVLDHVLTPTARKSTIFFPTTNFSESSGTIVNYESRMQRFFSVFNPMVYDNTICILEAWFWLYKIYYKIHNINNIDITLDHVIQDYINHIIIFKSVLNVAPNEKYRILNQKIARLSHRASSRTAIFSELNIHEPKQKNDENTMFAFSMEGNQQPNQDMEYIPFVWSPGWNSLHAWNKYIFKNDHYNSGVHIFQRNNLNKKYDLIERYDVNARNDEWKIIPYYVLFGSEELSQYSDVISKNYSTAYVIIHNKYKKILGLALNQKIEFECLGQLFQLSIQFSSKIPLKQLGLPLGFPNIPHVLLGCVVKNIRGVI
ncbi:NADH-quinone oxidoreductase subunit NuoG [Buchnera aphidicola]|uniref:NADH-quinone oxidoreductase n=1 Tax=Buchnera aphidicola (Sarucallis kahawaluokalani) TaxID=1241878 RepID=A0A4D6YLS7_9GAMM|nr:NADH-quinone oxidoreductase subunit NuoG [Buchnera aphidicola]QCI25915.1 NADH-quinone oxidoreductase subunit NuoG [Buchnera aphidicola (Sarucallis kahawaluokalani)]